MNWDQLNTYFTTYKKLAVQLPMGHVNFNSVWLSLLPENHTMCSDVSKLPILLALIHPDFTMDRYNRPNTNPDYQKSFSKKTSRNMCRIDLLTEGHVNCPYNTKITDCHADHIWPVSLGGATTGENRLDLCGRCNRQKSNSPFLFPGHKVPRWLRIRVEELFKKKSPA